MDVEVDQSGKIEDTNVDTVLAFSNRMSYVILIPAKVKRAAFQVLRARRKTSKANTLRLFSVSLFLLLQDHL